MESEHKYLESHDLARVVDDLVGELLRQRPENVVAFAADHFARLHTGRSLSEMRQSSADALRSQGRAHAEHVSLVRRSLVELLQSESRSGRDGSGWVDVPFGSKPLRVCVTGAAGLIAYSLVPMIAAGHVFGETQQIAISLLDVDNEFAAKGLKGLVLELEDCVYPLLVSVQPSTDPLVAFQDADYAVLCGAFPRKQGMERKDLLAKNADIFREQGLAIRQVGKAATKALVVGNPANTNALLLLRHSGLPARNVTALTRLDMNRARGLLARRLSPAFPGVIAVDVRNVTIWGNHSNTQVPDVDNATVQLPGAAATLAVRVAVRDDAWVDGPFVAAVQQRGAEVIAVRGASSATSAARAIADHMRDWHCGTQPGEYVSMGVWSDGSKYGIPTGLVYSMPCKCNDGEFSVVEGLTISAHTRRLMELSAQELVQERAIALEVTDA